MPEPNRRRQSSATIALGAMVQASAAPYGYTVSLWSSGAILMHFHPHPNVGEVLIFAMGALAAFTVLGLLAHPTLRVAEPMEPGPERVLAGALHWFAVGIAVGAVALVAQIPGWVAWLLGAFAATSLYLLVASVQLAFVTRWSEVRRMLSDRA